MEKNNIEILRLLKAMAEIFGKDMSSVTLGVFMEQLAPYPVEAVEQSLKRCLREMKFFPSLAEILSRIQEMDGRPGAEEAWAMIPKDEYSSVVWTKEMAHAYGVCRSLVDEDPIAARMAFKESYEAQLREARANGQPVEWTASFGFDRTGRAAALLEAVQKKRIAITTAKQIMPELEDHTVGQKLLPGGMASIGEISKKLLEEKK